MSSGVGGSSSGSSFGVANPAGIVPQSATGGTPGSLALDNPSLGKIDQQRKILEELEKQKKLLNQGNNESNKASPQNSGNGISSGISSSSSLTIDPTLSGTLNSNQRAALEAAAKTSFGYFIAQDSSFGNTILPVIPRPKP